MRRIKMQFTAEPDGNYLSDLGGIIRAHCSVPEGASDDYGYLTMKKAIQKVLETAGIDIEIEWWYGDTDILEPDAAADCEVDVDIDTEAIEEMEEE